MSVFYPNVSFRANMTSFKSNSNENKKTEIIEGQSYLTKMKNKYGYDDCYKKISFNYYLPKNFTCETFINPNYLGAIYNTNARYADTCLRDGDMEKLTDINNESYRHLSDSVIETINAVDYAFENMPGLEEDVMVYRTLAGCELPIEVQNAEEGDIIIPDAGYAQVGLYEGFCQKYMPLNDNDQYGYRPTLFKIKCPKGTKLSISKGTGSGYNEGMLPRNAQFRVLKKTISHDYDTEYVSNCPVRVYELEYLGSDFTGIKPDKVDNDTIDARLVIPLKSPVLKTISSEKTKNLDNIEMQIMEKIKKLNNNQKEALNNFLNIFE